MNRILLSVSLLALSATGVLAAETGDDAQIPNVVVTAERQGAKDIQQVPLAVTALDARQLETLNLRSYSDYLRLVPSVAVQEEGPGVNGIVIRGLATRGLSLSEVEDRSLVAVYIDDTPVTLQSANPDLKVLDLERVEVLRGPQGTLYGAGAMSGTVRQITAKPNLTDFFGDLEAVGSRTSGNGGYNGDVRATVNIPIVTDKAGLRAAAYSGTDSGYIRNVALGGKGDNNETSNQVRVALRVVPNDNLTIDLSTIYAHDFGGLNDAYTGLGSYTFTSLSPERSGDNTSISNLTIDYDFGAAHLVSSSSALIRKTFYEQSADFTVNDFVFGGNGALDAAKYTIANKVYDYTEEARLASSGSGPLKWTAGVFYETGTRNFWEDEPVAGFDARLGAQNGFPGYNSRANDAAFNPDDLFSGTQNTRDTQTALFAEATYSIGDFDVTAGVRYFDWSESYDLAFSGYFGNIADTSPANPFGSVPETSSSTATAKGVNPKFAADYHLDDDVLLFAEAAKGFRYGGNNQPVPLGICGGALKADGLSSAPANFGPDSLWSYSAGEKGSFFGNRLKANLIGYIVNWYDTQTVNTLSCSYYFTENGGKVQSRGAEVELEGVVLPGWTAGVNGSYTDAVTVGPIANLHAADGARAPYSPRYIVNLKTDYSRPLANGVLSVSAVWSFKGDAPTGFTPSSSSYRVIPASDSLSAAVTYRTGRWEYGLFGDNLTNGTRIVDYDRYPTLAGSQEPGDRVYYARPLTVGLRSKVSF